MTEKYIQGENNLSSGGVRDSKVHNSVACIRIT